MVSRSLFVTLVLALVAQRLYELDLSRRNEEKIHAAGGFEVYPFHFQIMRLLHAAWFVSMLAEVYLCGRTPWAPLVALGALCLGLGQSLRYAAIRTLGWRWSVRVLVIPGERLVTSGPYQWVRHPNYLGVCLELFGVPLLHGAVVTSALFTLANGALLAYRIRREEGALSRHAAG